MDILSSDRTVPAVIGIITGHLTNLRRCMTKSLLSSIPSRIHGACSTLQFLSTFPCKSIACSISLYSTWAGSSCTNSNFRRTRCGWCVSTMQKHISGTLAVYISLPATQKVGSWPKFASYGCHIIYNRNKKQLS